MSRVLLMQGNQAVVEGAIAAGVRFYGGYPITPSTEIAEGMAKRLPQVGGKFMQTEDELAGIGTVLGAPPGLFAEAGNDRHGVQRGNSVRDCGCAARRPRDGAADVAVPGRRDADALGHAW